MTPFHLLLVVVLLYSEIPESLSDPVSHVFVLKGNDLLLNVNQTVELNEETEFQWKFNTKIRIAKLTNEKKDTIFDPYKGRAELFKENYSLLLKNLQQSDSGDYAAVLSEGTDTTITEHKVTVEDPVFPVKLTVISNSSDPCNIIVTCSTVDSLITKTYRCDKQTCSYQGGEEATANYDSINVTVQEGSIICNHSNHVSWKKDTMDIKTYCGSKSAISNGVIASGAVAGVVGACLTFLVIWLKCKRPIEQKNKENTIYAVPEDIVPAQNRIQTPAEGVSTVSPTSTYALVQFHTGHEKSQNTMNSSLPETVYAQVDRAAKSNARSLSLPRTKNA